MRMPSGINPKRLALLLAVLAKHTEIRPYSVDVCLNVTGGECWWLGGLLTCCWLACLLACLLAGWLADCLKVINCFCARAQMMCTHDWHHCVGSCGAFAWIDTTEQAFTKK